VIDVRVQGADFDPGRQLARLGDLRLKAVASLVGQLEAEGDVVEILVDHYPPLARVELARIAAEAERRWPLAGIILIHRYGRLGPGDRILFAGAAAADVEAAGQACAFLVAAMRARLPFWRKDKLADGSARWR
jgi:molybdopterin synthase catalytic subunit